MNLIRNRNARPIRLIVAFVVISSSVFHLASSSRAQSSSPVPPNDHPLPYIARWNVGTDKLGTFPAYQLKLIKEGHHVLLSLQIPDASMDPDDPRWIAYYDDAIRQAARLKLPIAFSGTQWERVLSEEKSFRAMHEATNPNVVSPSGAILDQVSPFGSIGPWAQVGSKWTASPMMKKIQKLYPDPPWVLFISNNEHPKLQWGQAEQDRRYLLRHGRGKSDEFKRKIVSDGWIERYRALRDGMRSGLESPIWRDRSVFIGYDAFGPGYLGRWPGWIDYSLYTPARMNPWALAWDGATVSYYLVDWNDITDFTVYSPQVEAMNWVFMLEESRRDNPDFWFELSTWDGHEPGATDKYEAYRKIGQELTPARFAGTVQFGLWLLRPRGLREYRGYNDELRDMQAFFMPLLRIVDRVHENPTLRRFWIDGELVVNHARGHPFQAGIPTEYKGTARWFLLDTSLDPKPPWELDTNLPVFSLAMKIGLAKNRQWLVYAHAPAKARKGVTITIPGYRAVTLDVPVDGFFWLVDEASGDVLPLR